MRVPLRHQKALPCQFLVLVHRCDVVLDHSLFFDVLAKDATRESLLLSTLLLFFTLTLRLLATLSLPHRPLMVVVHLFFPADHFLWPELFYN